MSDNVLNTIAFYLPQFHRVKENDEWWGEGFTEWTAVKKSKPLYDGHYQPHIPLNNNYYDLMDRKTMEWQNELMHKYGVDGVAMYHYYFKDGRKLLEKPAENLLEWKSIDMPFCLYWVNQTWARTWSALSDKNAWSILEEPDKKKMKDQDLGNDGVLLLQEYGEEMEWCKHFEYLLPFFKDDRYIKVNDRPVFIVYNPDAIDCFHEMREVWKQKAREYGVPEPYYIGRNTDSPLYDEKLLNSELGTYLIDICKKRINYADICQLLIKEALLQNNKTNLCGLTGFDNTPRKGTKAFITENLNPEDFYKLIKIMLYISEQNNNRFLFINAWNEWGEGMHLEPDERFGYAFLEALKKAKEDYSQMKDDEIRGLEDLKLKACNERLIKLKNDKTRYYSIMKVLEEWLTIKQRNMSVAERIREQGYSRIAIYGCGILGKRLIDELEENKDIIVDYLIDKNGTSMNDIPCYRPESLLPPTDLIVVTPDWDYEKIRMTLKNISTSEVISLKTLIKEVIEVAQ